MTKRRLESAFWDLMAMVSIVPAVLVMLICCLVAPIPAVRFLKPRGLPEEMLLFGNLPEPRHTPTPQWFSARRTPHNKVRFS